MLFKKFLFISVFVVVLFCLHCRTVDEKQSSKIPRFGYVFEFHGDSLKLRDLLSFNYVENNHIIQTNLIHPFVDRENSHKEFRITFHSCFPNVIYINEEMLRFDGVEYRLVELVTKNWKRNHIFRDLEKTLISPWITMFGDLLNETADIAMCSVWLTEYENKYDLSTFHSHECYNLLVPKPMRLSTVTAIYTSFSNQVWLIFGLCFFVTWLLLWGNARIEILERTVYVSVSRTFVDVINIATSHGVANFPNQRSMNLLLLSWIFLALLIGICYTTMYTSRLTSPGYSKLIDTIEDFIANDMFWGSYQIFEDVELSLNASTKEAYHDFQRRCIIFKDNKEAAACLQSGKFGVLGATVNSRYFVSYDFMNQLHMLSSFRLMKKTCIFDFYSVFALQKFSPYTELFNDYALKFTEFGFSEYWYSQIYRDKHWFHKFNEDYPREDYEPKSLNMSRISGALLILIVCLVLSTIIFLCEIVFKKFFN